MPLAPGTKLGPYEIQSPLGAGGMGEVYRARDTRLDRDVALKLLPAAFAKDPDRLHRFEQEARAIAALNHPNILAIHDAGNHDGIPYLVSELLEGEALREALQAGPLPVRRVVECAYGIAQGLAAAHDKGIVHRDLKPENIFLTRDGRVKVLDFGLAKLVQPENAESVATLTSPATVPGMVMGTIGYMSPEQVRGDVTDLRTDIFSFGAVLYEMLTGKRAFKRDTAAETMTAILREEPPELNDTGWHGPLGLQKILTRCLEKNVERRFRSSSDLAFAIESLSGSGTEMGTHAVPAPTSGKTWWLWGAGVAAAVLLVATVLVAWSGGGKSQPKFTRLTYQLGFPSAARFAKDGETVVYSAQWNNDPLQVYTVRTEYPQSLKSDLPGAALLALSADGEMRITLDTYYHSNFLSGTMAETRIVGGASRALQNDVIAADFAPDGKSLAVARLTGEKVQLEYPQGKILFATSGYLDYLRISPRGDEVAFIEHPVYDDDRGWVSLINAQGQLHKLSGEYAAIQGLGWTPDGREVWFTASSGGENMQLNGLDHKGRVRSILTTAQRIRLLDIDARGRLLLSSEEYREEIVGLDSTTGHERMGLEWFNGSTLSDISPDGKAILLEEWGGVAGPLYEVAYRKLDGSAPVSLGPGAGPAFSPDGKMAAAAVLSQPPKIGVYPIGPGTGQKLLLGNLTTLWNQYWFPDGKHLLVVGARSGEALRTFEVELSSANPQPLGPPAWQGEAVSPDGKRVAGKNSASETSIFNRDTQQLQAVSAVQPDEEVQQWTRDGKGLLIRSGSPDQASVSRLDLASGNRRLIRQIKLSNRAGSVSKVKLLVTEDGNVYVYRVRRDTGTLYLVEGVR